MKTESTVTISSQRPFRLPAVCVVAALLAGATAPMARAQWGNLNPQAQRHLNNARGYEAAGDAIRRASEEMQRQLRERQEEERRQRDEERRERDAERRERDAERQKEQLRQTMERTFETQRQQQEQINRTLAINRPAPEASVTPPPSTASAPASRPATGYGQSQEPVVRAAALSGSPNEGAARKPDWMPYQPVSDNIWVSYCKVSEKFDKGRPLWTWSLKNWNDRPVKSLWFEYLEDGKWRTDLVPFTLAPRAGHGGWGSFTATGFQPPAIRITKVEFK